MTAFVADDQSTLNAAAIACSTRCASIEQLAGEGANLTGALTIATTSTDCSGLDAVAVVVDILSDACQASHYDSSMAPYRSTDDLHRYQ